MLVRILCNMTILRVKENFMKKKLTSFFLALIITATCIFPFQLLAVGDKNITVESVQTNASQFVEVKISANAVIDANIVALDINYDTSLELISVTPNASFTENKSVGIENQQRGSYKLLVGMSDTALDASFANGTIICTLKFKAPTVAGIYRVKINDSASSIVSSGEELIACSSNVGIITVGEGVACAGHTFGEETVIGSAPTYFAGNYSYKSCTACGYVESTITDPISTEILTPLGTAIRYAGSPSGIGAHFKVDNAKLTEVEQAGYTVNVGMEFVYGNRVEKFVFYGAGAPVENITNMADGVISAGIERLDTQQEGTICAYVEIIDPNTGIGRTERVYTHLNGDRNLSIKDIASVMNLYKYSEATVDYLTAVVAGGTFEDNDYRQ